jgi:cell division protein FtsB
LTLSIQDAEMLSTLRNLLGKRSTLLVAGLIILFWVLFLDSHSVLNRIQWHREADRLREQNRTMQAVIAKAQAELSRRDDEKEIERIARESYAMRRDSETVYRVEE